MKTFRDFILETKKYTRTRSREDAEKIRQSQENSNTYRLKNRQTKETPYWGLESKEKRKDQDGRRKENLKAISKKELEDHAKRNLHPSPSKTANKALKIERQRKKDQRSEAQTKSKETDKQHDVDHIQAQPNRRSEKTRSRFQSIHPGDSSDNRRVIPSLENREKNSKDTGEKKTTRSSVIRRALMRARENNN